MLFPTIATLVLSAIAASAQVVTCGPLVVGCATAMTAAGNPYTIQASSCNVLGVPTIYTTTSTYTSLSSFVTTLTTTLKTTVTGTTAVAKVSNSGHCYCQWTAAPGVSASTIACDYNCPTGTITYATPATSLCPPATFTVG
ncbi:hypothetical protein FRB93_000855 [Tulasnella sp. JGI-2019a]|nr:hypothetical protein FRB93_000855 [Tulasnella sp. JGI-2019a]